MQQKVQYFLYIKYTAIELYQNSLHQNPKGLHQFKP